jgi:putative ubiquitin-RnfH superfamily antitoxin RatB of RatAB toxin-antitoxin module
VLDATLHLTSPATVQDALCALPTDWQSELAGLDHHGELGISIWGKRAGRHAVLQAGDRLELCRPLRVDPKVARRERFVQQGKKRAGLFAPKKEVART